MGVRMGVLSDGNPLDAMLQQARGRVSPGF